MSLKLTEAEGRKRRKKMTGKEIIKQYENQEPIQNNKNFKTLEELIDEKMLETYFKGCKDGGNNLRKELAYILAEEI